MDWGHSPDGRLWIELARDWEHWPSGATVVRSLEDYRIVRVAVPGRITFSAYGPDIGREAHAALLRVHYPLGVPVPQRRELLGAYLVPAEARRACELHRENRHGT